MRGRGREKGLRTISSEHGRTSSVHRQREDPFTLPLTQPPAHPSDPLQAVAAVESQIGSPSTFRAIPTALVTTARGMVSFRALIYRVCRMAIAVIRMSHLNRKSAMTAPTTETGIVAARRRGSGTNYITSILRR